MIISPLRIVAALLSSTRPSHTSKEEPSPCANASPTIATHGSPSRGTDNRPNRRAAYRTVRGGLVRPNAPELLQRIVSADAVVKAKLIKGLTGPGECENAWSRRETGAASEQRENSENRPPSVVMRHDSKFLFNRGQQSA